VKSKILADIESNLLSRNIATLSECLTLSEYLIDKNIDIYLRYLSRPIA